MFHTSNIDQLFHEHISEARHLYDKLMESANAEAVIIHAGSEQERYLDDNLLPFWPNPQFCQWVPEMVSADSILVIRQGAKPVLLYNAPVSFWDNIKGKPSGFWVDEFEIKILSSITDIINTIPTSKGKVIGLGGNVDLLKKCGASEYNPPSLTNKLDWLRGIKTPYEQYCIQMANDLAVKGHIRAKQAFYEGMSELDIHLAYLSATQQTESELPYNNVIALNEHSAILHHGKYNKVRIQANTFLIDAGAGYNFYPSDITRTYCRDNGPFHSLIQRLEKEALSVIDEVRPGKPYTELHDEMHQRIARIICDAELVHVSADDAYELGYTRTFFPHGLGHLIGLTVHDAGGKLLNESGDIANPPTQDPYLRCLRVLEKGMTVTIEPGIYFIPMLLESVRNNGDYNWTLIDELTPYGGIRIEDNIVVTDVSSFNFTRFAFNKARKADIHPIT